MEDSKGQKIGIQFSICPNDCDVVYCDETEPYTFYENLLNKLLSQYVQEFGALTNSSVYQYFSWLENSLNIEVKSVDRDGRTLIGCIAVFEQDYMWHFLKYKD